MNPTHRLALVLVLLAWAGAARAAEIEPAIQRTVVEDDQVRIEELRVRGQLQAATVHNKKSAAPDYEIIVPRGGRDPSRDRDASGQRVWRLFSF